MNPIFSESFRYCNRGLAEEPILGDLDFANEEPIESKKVPQPPMSSLL